MRGQCVDLVGAALLRAEKQQIEIYFKILKSKNKNVFRQNRSCRKYKVISIEAINLFKSF